MDRPSWIEQGMFEAEGATRMSTCPSRQVGAVFIRDNRVVVKGFSGVPAHYPHPKSCVRKDRCIPSGEQLHLCPCIHAEANAISNAARVGVSLVGCVVYCTTRPCQNCMGMLANVGVTEVIYRDEYGLSHEDMVTEIAQHAGIPLLTIRQKYAASSPVAPDGTVIERPEELTWDRTIGRFKLSEDGNAST